jgi:transcriptional regulator with PAS, ATPase and Fis domain
MTYDESRAPTGDELAAPCVVVALECSRPLAGSGRYSAGEVDEVVLGRGDRRNHVRTTTDGVGLLRITVPDGWMSSNHVRIRREGGLWVASDDGSKNGTYVNGVRIEQRALDDGDLIEAGNTIFLFRAGVRRSYQEAPDMVVDDQRGLPGMQTLNPAFADNLADLAKVAPSAAPVLITGETGTGKEVTARALHQLSGRSGAFVAVNCGALAPTLIESELFGYRKGAFSGATDDRPGLIRTAHGGTLFLDEIAELPEASQVKLLRVLQEKEVVPVGDVEPVPVDIRVVAATHQDVAARVEDGRFRRDLYGRLAGFQIALPPLRDRLDDLGILVAALLTRLLGDRAGAIKLQRSAGRALFRYNWPLNVRELEQALIAATALADGDKISLEQLPPPLRGAGGRTRHAAPDADEEALRDRLIALLKQHQGNVSAVARELGKARVQIRRWCKRFGIDVERYR